MQPSRETKDRRRCSRELMADAGRSVKASHDTPVAENAEDLDVTEQLLYRWERQMRIDDAGDPNGPATAAEREASRGLRQDVPIQIAGYVDQSRNDRRRHSSPGYPDPVQYKLAVQLAARAAFPAFRDFEVIRGGTAT